MSYREGDRVKVFRRGVKGDLLATVTVQEDMCDKVFSRFLFFKYNIAPGDCRIVKVSSDRSTNGT